MKIDGLDEFIKQMHDAANGGLKEEMAVWLEAMGFEFLDIVQDEIIRTETVLTRRLLNSFSKGDSDNEWTISKGGLSLDIGTNLEYASYVNDGHWTNPEGVDERWVPGWIVSTRSGDSAFVYDPNAKTGILLRQKWVDGTGYWDSAMAIFEKMFEKSLERRLQGWIDAAF